MSAKELARKILKREEGWKEKPYYCSEGYPTIGYGFKIGTRHAPIPDIVMSISEGDKKLDEWIENIIYSLNGNADTTRAYNNCNFDRQAIMISMVYQLGMYGILKFKKFIGACNDKDWNRAAEQMLDSLAARQAPNRFKRQSDVMRSGSIAGIY